MKIKKNCWFFFCACAAITGTPLLALAAKTAEQGNKTYDLIAKIANILSNIVLLLMAVAVVVFLWGILEFLTAGGEKEGVEKGRNRIIFGIIGLFVMVAMWGLVNIIAKTLDLKDPANQGREWKAPELPGLGKSMFDVPRQ